MNKWLSRGLLLMAIWTPQSGPQAVAAVCPVDKILFGGSRGGGKSDAAIGRQIDGSMTYGRDWNGLMLRRKYRDFAEIRRRFDELIAAGMPAQRFGGDQMENSVRYGNGAAVTLSAVSRLELAQSFQGQQFTEITLDECTNFPFFTNLVDKLNGCLRSPAGVPCRLFCTGNPGGPGHMQVKQMFIGDGEWEPNVVHYDEAGESYVFIPSFLDDNRVLCEMDPKYVRRLRSIKDPVLRKAWLDGDWDVFIGQAFSFDPQYHVIAPMPIPTDAQLYSTFDWGFGKPFDWRWWWIDPDGRMICFAEWYGCSGVPDEGLRLADSAVAAGIVEREKHMGIWGRPIKRLCGPDCFAKRPDTQGGGQGPASAEIFAEAGIYMQPGDPSRIVKIRQFRERLLVPRDKDGKQIDRPMLQVFPNCRAFIRTIPALCMDELKPEDIDTEQEDHTYDSAAFLAMARPLAASYANPTSTTMAPGGITEGGVG